MNGPKIRSTRRTTVNRGAFRLDPVEQTSSRQFSMLALGCAAAAEPSGAPLHAVPEHGPPLYQPLVALNFHRSSASSPGAGELELGGVFMAA
eukprot:scaffold1033_cov135-Isochrysis_galbana.AAC.8